METLTIHDAWSKMLRKGIALWRPCSFSLNDDGCEVSVNDVVFEPTPDERTGRTSYLVRLNLDSTDFWEPQIISKRNNRNYLERGIVVFADEIPPPNWTHLVLSGTSIPFTKAGKPERGGCLFARVGQPYDMQDYVTFRKTMFETLSREQSSDIERAIEVSNENWIGGNWAVKVANKDETRLVLRKAWNDSAYYNFGCIEPPKDVD
jgi:hypothetical protein